MCKPTVINQLLKLMMCVVIDYNYFVSANLWIVLLSSTVVC